MAASTKRTSRQPASKKTAATKSSTTGAKTEKAAPKKAAPKKAAPKKAAPKKAAPKNAAPNKVAPKKAAPKKSAPKKAAPTKAAPKNAAPKKAAPKKTASKKAAPKNAAPKKAAPKKAAPAPTSRVVGAGKKAVATRTPVAAKTKKPTAAKRESTAAKDRSKSAAPTKRAARADDKPSLDQVLAAIDAAEDAPLASRLKELDELQERVHRLEGEDLEEAQAALASAQQGCIDFAYTDADARGALLASVRENPWRTERVEQLAKFADDETYQLVREQAQVQFETAYSKTQPSWIFALGGFAKQGMGAYAEEARELLLGGFRRVVAYAREKKEPVNGVAFGALAYAAALVAHAETGPALHQAFRIAAGLDEAVSNVHHELELAAGPLALAMSALEYTGAVAEIEAFANAKGEDYRGADFVMQCRYALWMLKKDSEAAAAYVADVGNVKGMGWAVAALADLDARDARGVVEARAATVEHPVAKEVIAEALHRLDAQASRQAQVYGAPPVSGRMVWMFGRRSSTESALGNASDNASDNVFVQRAIARTRNAELDVVYDADGSTPDD